MKEFLVYTGLRLLLFVAALAIVLSAWVLLAGEANWLVAVVIAFLISGIGSYFLLDRQREAFARRVQERAERASTRFEEMRAREDQD